MSKNRGGGEFSNKAYRVFKTVDKVDLMSQQEIFDILETDISTILSQITDSRNHRGKYPTYMANAFANLSTALWFSSFIHCNIKVKQKGKGKFKFVTDSSVLTDDDIESLRQLLADVYKKSVSNTYERQMQEFKDRNHLISEAFCYIYPEVYELTKKLAYGESAISKAQRRDLTIQIYGDPEGNMKFIHKIFNNSPISNKKKIKLLKKMYKDRFKAALGAALTVDSNNSDFVAMVYEYIMDKKLKKRAPFILGYAKAYKKNKSYYFRLSNGKFYEKNKKLIKELKDLDIGFKKAFKPLKEKKKKTDKDDVKISTKFQPVGGKLK